MLRFIVLFGIILLSDVLSTDAFDINTIKRYMTEENPYISKALGDKYIAQERLSYSQGNYDTQLSAKYENKEYPVTYGKYYSLGVEKPTELGIDLSLSYRYADGTQEYNNIKTGEDGEILLGAKIPFFSVLNQIDKRRLQLGLAEMNLKKSDFKYKETMRSFYFNVMANYYSLLSSKERLIITEELFKKVEIRQSLLATRLKQGSLSELELIEGQQQVINRKQRLVSEKTAYESMLINFLKFLNLSKETFSAQYHLPDLPDSFPLETTWEQAMVIALQNRPDLLIFDTEIKQLLLQHKENERSKYPELDIGLYGVYDLNDDTGFKVSLNLNFPIERNQYNGKKAELKQNIKLIDAIKETRLIELKSDLITITESLQMLLENIQNSKDELILVKKLETLEHRKYELGSSSLFILNQREIQTTETQEKLLQYKLNYQLMYQTYLRVINQHMLEEESQDLTL